MKKRKLFIGLTMLFAATALFGMTACDSEGGSSAGGSSASGNSSIGNSSSGSSSGGSQSNTQIVTPVVSLPKEPFTITVRTDTVKITDSGRASQKMDKVLLSNYFNVKDAYNAGYTKLHVTFSFDVMSIRFTIPTTRAFSIRKN